MTRGREYRLVVLVVVSILVFSSIFVTPASAQSDSTTESDPCSGMPPGSKWICDGFMGIVEWFIGGLQDIVESALPEARQEVRRKSIDMLSPHQRVTFRVIEEHGKNAPGELIEEYRERVDDPKSNRTIRNYLNKLERYDLVAAEGTTRDRMYRCLSHQ